MGMDRATGGQLKRCTGCDEDLPEEAFGWKDRATGRRRARCRACVRAYQAHWYRENAVRHRASATAARRRRYEVNRGLVDAAKSVPCADCGRRFRSEEMDFDHVRGVKAGNVADMVRHASPERLLAEIAKCEVVCAVCHRIRTADRIRA